MLWQDIEVNKAFSTPAETTEYVPGSETEMILTVRGDTAGSF